MGKYDSQVKGLLKLVGDKVNSKSVARAVFPIIPVILEDNQGAMLALSVAGEIWPSVARLEVYLGGFEHELLQACEDNPQYGVHKIKIEEALRRAHGPFYRLESLNGPRVLVRGRAARPILPSQYILYRGEDQLAKYIQEKTSSRSVQIITQDF